MRRSWERLMFERDFRLLCIQPPDIDYYAGLLQRYLKLEGFCLEMPVRPLIERLLRYRGQHFCERDLFCVCKAGGRAAGTEKRNCAGAGRFCSSRLERSNFARKIFCSMVGREEVKSQIERICSQRIVMERFGRWENGGKTIWSSGIFRRPRNRENPGGQSLCGDSCRGRDHCPKVCYRREK